MRASNDLGPPVRLSLGERVFMALTLALVAWLGVAALVDWLS